MRITRAGFTNEDFYGSNDTDVVHFRYLHKLLRSVPTLTISDVSDAKFMQVIANAAKPSKYGSNTYATVVTTINADHVASDQVVNPFIDDQLDKFYNDGVKPQVDRLDGRINDLEKVVAKQGDDIKQLQGTVHDQEQTLTALEQRVQALENPTK